ncbi:MAG: hypothetical protein ACRD3W_23585 [Terriglobales bacterium]
MTVREQVDQVMRAAIAEDWQTAKRHMRLLALIPKYLRREQVRWLARHPGEAPVELVEVLQRLWKKQDEEAQATKDRQPYIPLRTYPIRFMA